jgi:hypothetical protein
LVREEKDEITVSERETFQFSISVSSGSNRPLRKKSIYKRQSIVRTPFVDFMAVKY